MPLSLTVIAAVGLLVAAPCQALDLPEDIGIGILGMLDSPAYGPGAENSVFGGPSSVHDVYFILANPEIGGIGGVEFAVRFDPPGSEINFVRLSVELPVDGLLFEPMPFEFVAGFQTPLSVPGGQVMVLKWTILLLNDSTYTCKLGPVSSPTIPGEMAYASWTNPNDVRPMVPYSNGYSHDMPVFGINTEVIGTQATSWSSVKALFE